MCVIFFTVYYSYLFIQILKLFVIIYTGCFIKSTISTFYPFMFYILYYSILPVFYLFTFLTSFVMNYYISSLFISFFIFTYTKKIYKILIQLILCIYICRLWNFFYLLIVLTYTVPCKKIIFTYTISFIIAIVFFNRCFFTRIVKIFWDYQTIQFISDTIWCLNDYILPFPSAIFCQFVCWYIIWLL